LQSMMWRNSVWWSSTSLIHENPGAPKTKWEDIFRKTLARDDWLMEAMEDKVKWKSGEERFVERATALCNPIKKKAGAMQKFHNLSLVNEKLKMKHDASKFAVKDDETSAVVPDVLWQCANGEEKRIVLMGDSKLVVNWSNGWWPVRCGLYGDIVEWAQGKMHQWWKHGNWPRCDWAPWARHVKREHNKDCDELATAGKMMETENFVLDVYCELGSYVFGGWDGGYTPGAEFVGVGWKIWTADELEKHGKTFQPRWRVAACGHGKLRGQGSTFAEIMAFQSLVETIDRLNHRIQEIDEVLPPWKAPTMDWRAPLIPKIRTYRKMEDNMWIKWQEEEWEEIRRWGWTGDSQATEVQPILQGAVDVDDL